MCLTSLKLSIRHGIATSHTRMHIKMYLDRRPSAVPRRSASLPLPVFLAVFSGTCVIRSHRPALFPRGHRVCLFSLAL